MASCSEKEKCLCLGQWSQIRASQWLWEQPGWVHSTHPSTGIIFIIGSWNLDKDFTVQMVKSLLILHNFSPFIPPLLCWMYVNILTDWSLLGFGKTGYNSRNLIGRSLTKYTKQQTVISTVCNWRAFKCWGKGWELKKNLSWLADIWLYYWWK